MGQSYRNWNGLPEDRTIRTLGIFRAEDGLDFLLAKTEIPWGLTVQLANHEPESGFIRYGVIILAGL